jgi:hypothetical protein
MSGRAWLFEVARLFFVNSPGFAPETIWPLSQPTISTSRKRRRDLKPFFAKHKQNLWIELLTV